MSNVANKAILAIHGYVCCVQYIWSQCVECILYSGSDTNVPTWHSREYYSVVKTWGDGRNITYAAHVYVSDRSVYLFVNHLDLRKTKANLIGIQGSWITRRCNNSSTIISTPQSRFRM